MSKLHRPQSVEVTAQAWLAEPDAMRGGEMGSQILDGQALDRALQPGRLRDRVASRLRRLLARRERWLKQSLELQAARLGDDQRRVRAELAALPTDKLKERLLAEYEENTERVHEEREGDAGCILVVRHADGTTSPAVGPDPDKADVTVVLLALDRLADHVRKRVGGAKYSPRKLGLLDEHPKPNGPRALIDTVAEYVPSVIVDQLIGTILLPDWASGSPRTWLDNGPALKAIEGARGFVRRNYLAHVGAAGRRSDIVSDTWIDGRLRTAYERDWISYGLSGLNLYAFVREQGSQRMKELFARDIAAAPVDEVPYFEPGATRDIRRPSRDMTQVVQRRWRMKKRAKARPEKTPGPRSTG